MDRRAFLRATACASAAAVIAPVAVLPPPETMDVLVLGPTSLKKVSVPATNFAGLSQAQSAVWARDFWETARARTFPHSILFTEPKEFTMDIKHTPVESSNVVSYGYDAESRTLEVKYRGGSYRYPNTSAAEFDALRKADSVGKHIAEKFGGRSGRAFQKRQADGSWS